MTFTVKQAVPTLGKITADSKTFGDGEFSITKPTSLSSGAFTFTSSDSKVVKITEEGKVTVTYKITRKVDTAQLQANWAGLGRNTQNCFKWAADISTAAMRSVQELDNVAYLQAAKFITSTPAKPALTIKL